MPSISITVFNEKTKISVPLSINTSNQLEQVITKICIESFNLPSQVDDNLPVGQAYSLRLEDDSLLTEEVLKKKLENNATLKLTASAAIETKEAVEKLRSGDVASIKLTMFALQKRLRERDYVNEFVNKDGFNAVKKVIMDASGNTLAYALVALNNLMDMDSGWDSFEDAFIAKLVSVLVNESLFTISKPVTSIILKIANADEKSTGNVRCYGFDVLNKAIMTCGSATVITTLIQRLSANDHLVQLSSLTLLNSLFKHSLNATNKEQFAKLLYQNGTREIIISLMAKQNIHEEIEKALLEFQRLCIYEFFLRKSQPVGLDDKKTVGLLNDILQMFGFPRSMTVTTAQSVAVAIDPSSHLQSPSPSRLSFAPMTQLGSQSNLTSEGNLFTISNVDLSSTGDLTGSKDNLKRQTVKKKRKKSKQTTSNLRGELKEEETTTPTVSQLNLNEIPAADNKPQEEDEDDVVIDEFDDSNLPQEQGDARFFRRLGFKSEDPIKDTSRVGLLGLQLLIDMLIKRDVLELYKVMPINTNLQEVEQNWQQRPPLCRASFEITELLCDHWDISTGVMTKTCFQAHILSFEQVQTALLQTYLRLWGEDLMEDGKQLQVEAEYNAHFIKILAIVRSHLKTCLKNESIPLDALLPLIINEKYVNIKQRYIKDIEEEDQLVNHQMARTLRKKLYTETYDFIKDQRINCLLQGAWFTSPILNKNTKKLGARFFKLSNNRKTIHWAEYPEIRDMTPTDLPNKIELANITDILIGPGDVKKKEQQQQQQQDLIFRIITTAEDTSGNTSDGVIQIEIICLNPTQFSEWTDGFNMLLERPIQNKDTAEFVNSLSDLELRLHLLDIAAEGIELPKEDPVLPELPPVGARYFHDNVIKVE